MYHRATYFRGYQVLQIVKNLLEIFMDKFKDEQVVSLQNFMDKSIVRHMARQKASGEACGLLASNNVTSLNTLQ